MTNPLNDADNTTEESARQTVKECGPLVLIGQRYNYFNLRFGVLVSFYSSSRDAYQRLVGWEGVGRSGEEWACDVSEKESVSFILKQSVSIQNDPN